MKRSSLKVIQDLLADFDKAGITYAHWKSNIHLRDSLSGLTDLDILIDRGQTPLVKNVLSQSGFRLFPSVAWRRHRVITDYYGFDEPTGSLVHLHLHEELWIGQKFVKEYHLPREPLLLEKRIFLPQDGIYIIDPRFELLLLLLRTAARLPETPLFLSRFLIRRAYKNIQEELSWLFSKADGAVIPAEELLDPEISRSLRDFLEKGDPKAFVESIVALRRWLKPCGPASLWKTTAESFLKKARVVYCRLLRSSRPILCKRTPSGEGRVIAVIGIDGSGKSAITARLTPWLREMTDVWCVYLGTGEGKNTILMEFFKLLFRLYQWVKKVVGQFRGRRAAKSVRGKAASWLRSAWAVPVAFERSLRLRDIARARRSGIVVLTDRYLQAQNPDFLDGPLLGRWRSAKSVVLRRLADWEHRVYASAQKQYAPDMVIRLNIDVATAQKRKQGSFDDLEMRVRAVRDLSFPPSTTIVDISASQSLEEVVLEAKKAIWRLF